MAGLPGRVIIHTNDETFHVNVDDFTDPRLPRETILPQYGFGRHAGIWYHWIPHWVPPLARRYRIIGRNARGHGYSSAPDERNYDYTIDTICGEIVNTLDQLEVGRVHFSENQPAA